MLGNTDSVTVGTYYDNRDFNIVNVSGSLDTVSVIEGFGGTINIGGSSDTTEIHGFNDFINISGSTDTTSIAGFNHVITLSSSNTTQRLYAASDTIDVTGNNLGLSFFSSPFGYDGLNHITISGTNDSISTLGPNNTIDLAASNTAAGLTTANSTINVTGSNDNLAVTGGQNSVILGLGTDSVAFNGGSNAVTLGSGNDSVSFSSGTNAVNAMLGSGATLHQGDSLIGGTGSDTLNLTGVGSLDLSTIAFKGFEVLNAAQNENITFGASNLVINASSGMGDSFHFHSNAAGTFTINGFIGGKATGHDAIFLDASLLGPHQTAAQWEDKNISVSHGDVIIHDGSNIIGVHDVKPGAVMQDIVFV